MNSTNSKPVMRNTNSDATINSTHSGATISKGVENYTTFEAFEFTLCKSVLIHGLYSVITDNLWFYLV